MATLIKKNPPASQDEINAVINQYKGTVPKNYLKYMKKYNGGGYESANKRITFHLITVRKWWIQLKYSRNMKIFLMKITYPLEMMREVE
jgi:hypothetical protein